MSKGPKTTTTTTQNTTQNTSGAYQNNQAGVSRGSYEGQSRGTSEGSYEGQTGTQYGWQQMPDTPDISRLRDFEFASDPSSPYRFARARQDLDRITNNPYGAYTTPAVRDAQMRTGSMNLTQQAGQTAAEENAVLRGLQYGQRSNVAQLTAPRLVQTGTTSSGSNQETNTGSTSGNSTELNAGTSSGTSSGSSTGTATGTGTSQQSGGLGQQTLLALM
jgi:hypothetical protein